MANVIKPKTQSELNALGEQNRMAQANYLNKVNGTTTNGTPTPPTQAPTIDTSSSNVIGLNNQINTLFKKNTSSGLDVSGSTLGSNTNQLTTKPPVALTTPEDITKATIANQQSAITNEQAAQESAKKNAQDAIAQAASSTQNLVANEVDYAAKKASLAQEKIVNLNLSQAEYTAEMERQKNEAVTTMQPLLNKEKEANQAELDKVKAVNEQSVMEAEKQRLVEQQLANISLANMGLTQTPYAVATTQRIATEGAIKIATVKATNQYNYATVAKEMNKLEFAHQNTINKVVGDANLAIIDKREKTRESIVSVKDNILLSEKEKNEKIEKIKNEYIKFRGDTESTMFSRIRESNKTIESGLQTVQTRLDKDKEDSKKELSSILTNGQWDILPADKKASLAQRSGMSIGEISAMKNSTVYTAVSAGLKALLGEGFIASPDTANIVYQAAMSRVAMGEPLNVAVANAIKLNIAKLPQVRESQSYQEQLRRLTLKEKEADVDVKVSKAQVDKQAAKNPWMAADKTLQDKPGYILQYNKDSGEARYVQADVYKTPEEWKKTTGAALLNAPTGEVIPSRLAETTNKANGKECGEFANDATGTTISAQTVDERSKVFTDSTPLAGGQVFFKGEGYNSKYGHIGVVTTVSPDGTTITVKDSNYNGDGRVGERTIPATAASGFYNSTSLATQLKEDGKTSVYDIGKKFDVASAVLAKYGVDVNKNGVNLEEISRILNSQGTEEKATQYLINSGIIAPPIRREDGENQPTTNEVIKFLSSNWASKNFTEALAQLKQAGITENSDGLYLKREKATGDYKLMDDEGINEEVGRLKNPKK